MLPFSVSLWSWISPPIILPSGVVPKSSSQVEKATQVQLPPPFPQSFTSFPQPPATREFVFSQLGNTRILRWMICRSLCSVFRRTLIQSTPIWMDIPSTPGYPCWWKNRRKGGGAPAFAHIKRIIIIISNIIFAPFDLAFSCPFRTHIFWDFFPRKNLDN